MRNEPNYGLTPFPFSVAGFGGPGFALGASGASPFAGLHPGGEGLILYANQRRKMRAADAAALKLIEQLLPLLGRALHSARNIGPQQNRLRCRFRCQNKTRRSFHTRKHYDIYDSN